MPSPTKRILFALGSTAILTLLLCPVIIRIPHIPLGEPGAVIALLFAGKCGAITLAGILAIIAAFVYGRDILDDLSYPSPSNTKLTNALIIVGAITVVGTCATWLTYAFLKQDELPAQLLLIYIALVPFCFFLIISDAINI